MKSGFQIVGQDLKADHKEAIEAVQYNISMSSLPYLKRWVG